MVFLILLFRAGEDFFSWLPADSFLRLDPLLAAGLPLLVREWIPTLLPGLVVLALAILLGRVFCGYICPMGATLDLARRAVGLSGQKAAPSLQVSPSSYHWPWTKYLLLLAMLSAVLLGVNMLFWGSPIALITRFYALLIEPLLLLIARFGISIGQPVFDALGLTTLGYMQVAPRRYDALLFVLAFFGLLFWLERLRPRFWCRYLCPAGALLGLLSIRPIWRRRVSECVSCGQCARNCPMAAIAEDGIRTRHSECITCRKCADLCPVGGIAFSPLATPALSRPENTTDPVIREEHTKTKNTSRRAFISAAGSAIGAGMLLGGVQYSSVRSLLLAEERGLLWPEHLVRPPGAVPEPAFLDRCIRCGECMKVCPSNGLQPLWSGGGLDQIFSPILVARRGTCEPDCHRCGQVCPTQAIQSLPLDEKHWAKIGTAVVLPYRCLAWAEDRSCMVCQETCPYGAVTIVQKEGLTVPVPVVNASRCYGCGYCEQHCPVRLPAIVVQPLNALRLAEGQSYQEAARNAGLVLEANATRHPHAEEINLGEDDLPPGFLP